MQSITPRIVQIASLAPEDIPPAVTAPKEALANRLENMSTGLDQAARMMAQGFVEHLKNDSPDKALLECLEGCCELVEIIEEMDEFQPEADSNQQKKINDAVLGLGRLLNINQVALNKEKSLHELLNFSKALAAAAEESLQKRHPASEKFNASLSQQEQKTKTVEERQKSIETELKNKNLAGEPRQKLQNARNLLSNSIEDLKKSIDLNAQPQCFGSGAKKQLKSISDMIIDLNKQIGLVDKRSYLEQPENTAARADLSALLHEQVKTLEAKKAVLENYLSPIGINKVCTAKIQCLSAAQAILEREKNAKNQPTILSNIKVRISTLEDLSKNKKVVDTKNLQGQKKLGFFQQLLHPYRAGRQETLLKARASGFTSATIKPDAMVKTTKFFTEEMFMQTVLEEALKPPYSSSAIKKLFREQMSEVINGRDWAKINSSFNVPLRSQQGAQIMVPVTTTTSPAGNALTDEKSFNIVSENSPITKKTVNEFRGGDAKKPSIRGVNSHCATETTHCTSLATTELNIDGEVAFTGTRHGVISAYDLDVAHIQALPIEKREDVMQTLSIGASNQATQLIIGKPATAKEELDALPDTDLQTSIKSELINLGITKDQLEDTLKDTTKLAELALNSPVLCQLVKRAANLNRAREALITELNHNKKLQARIQANELISFNSISLLTPDQLRAAKNQITGEKNSENERQMLIDQAQAWKDLQAEINNDGIRVNGTVLKAKIRSFNFGVNKGAVELSSNPVIGELVSGWEYADAQNAEGIYDLFGDPKDTSKVGEVGQHLKAKSAELYEKKQKLDLQLRARPADKKAINELDKEIKALAANIHIIEQLSEQIKAMWLDKSYRQGGAEPYKMVTRLALLSYMLDGGTLFNCKSGKDRTGELDIEVKYLAFQIHTSGGTVPKPDRERSMLEKVQLAVFMFEDESRRTMQEYNTGHGGSKLRGAWALYDTFTASVSDAALAIKEYLGGSGNAGS